MAARGLVERKGFATDARGAVAALTKTGRIPSQEPVLCRAQVSASGSSVR